MAFNYKLNTHTASEYIQGMDAVLGFAYSARNLATPVLWPLNTSGVCSVPSAWLEYPHWGWSRKSGDLARRVIIAYHNGAHTESRTIISYLKHIRNYPQFHSQVPTTAQWTFTYCNILFTMYDCTGLFGHTPVFFFESLNGHLLRLRHGTHHMCLQVCMYRCTGSVTYINWSEWSKRSYLCNSSFALLHGNSSMTYVCCKCVS